ncbi:MULTISPECIES: LCP family protein [unclassified Pseudoclavibacter]|uniref:LCP family protein n=1 Tax=unclassified Pseudoclavibacter TaxID=2615177 RepID=UPI0012EF2DC1|nr:MULTISPECIES: LCP family protein [unclassified Pseudoclavibacter]MBF4458510.1 LCP family protein [Pseudoclavibacter sp. VKM Ac-2867]VXB53983.1 LytR family transcriptional regulator [Pseudoclavibacter sp. 8L]
MTLTLPLRYPDASSPQLMTRRAWWLLLANFFLPGTAQILAGNRKFGRFMLSIWLGGIAAVLVVLLMALVLRGPLLFVFSTTLGITAVHLVLMLYVAMWVVSGLDALRLVRIIKLEQVARPLIAIVGVVLVTVPLVFAAVTSQVANQGKSAIEGLFGGASNGLQLPSDGQINIMMLGGDRGADREGLRPDSISVMSFNAFTGKLTTIGLPRAMESFPFSEGHMRDLYPDLYEGCAVDVCYLNSVYTEATIAEDGGYADAAEHGSEPGIEAMRDAVEGITGLSIQYYVLVDMAGFTELIDALGGVDINVTERVGIGINDDGSPGWAPATEFIEVGQQHMDGSTALWYARSRYETTDFARMERQRQLQEAMVATMTPTNLLGKIGPVTDALEKVVQTDIPEGMIGYVGDLLLKSRSGNSVRLDIVPPNFDQGNPDIPAIHAAVQDAIASDPPEATPAPEETAPAE